MKRSCTTTKGGGWRAWALLLITLCLSTPSIAGPEENSQDALWRDLKTELEAGIRRGDFTGATILVGSGDKVLLHKAVGIADVETGEPMTCEHLFDAASLTKPLVTAVSVLILAQEGKVSLDAPVTDYLNLSLDAAPTIRQLLTHQSGLPPVLEIDQLDRPTLQTEPGRQFVYSDVGFILLARVVEKVSGQTLDRFYQARVAQPLELKTATFRPTGGAIVPTFGVPKGTVHDPRARALGGVAGHAGLFATALDVHRELSRLSRVLKPETLHLLFAPAGGGRTLGLDQDTSFSTARGARFSPLTSAGHTGFTGTSFWWDEPTGLHVVLMTSRLHPDNVGDVKGVRYRVASLVAEHFLGKQVKTGLDNLVDSDWSEIAGQRVGFVLNQSSRDRFGRHLTELLATQKRFQLVSLFTPEHGITGQRDENIQHGFHPSLKVPIYSLYGETREPDPVWLADLDTVVFDLQDAGVRYYTYISTLQAVLKVAARTGTRVVVLDRPNPLGGRVVDGPIARDFSFIACDALPMVHGMTMGEIAGFLNRRLHARLEVVKMSGWTRDMTWKQTGLSMIAPSPNLAEWESVELYPVIGQLEWCSLSVGRGTRAPFRIFGAPYIKDPAALSTLLNEQLGDDLEFLPRYFVPTDSKFEGQLCGGVEVRTRRPPARPAQLGLKIARTLAKFFPQEFRLQDMAAHYGFQKGQIPTEGGPDAWRIERQEYLLY